MNSTYLCRIGIRDGRGILATAKAIKDGYAIDADIFHLEIGNFYFRYLMRTRREWQCEESIENQAIHTNPVNAFMFESLYLMDGETVFVDLAKHLGIYTNNLYAMLVGDFGEAEDGKVGFVVNYDQPTAVACFYDDSVQEEISSTAKNAFEEAAGVANSPVFGKVRIFYLDMVVPHKVYEDISIEEGRYNGEPNRFDMDIYSPKDDYAEAYKESLQSTRRLIIKSASF